MLVSIILLVLFLVLLFVGLFGSSLYSLISLIISIIVLLFCSPQIWSKTIFIIILIFDIAISVYMVIFTIISNSRNVAIIKNNPNNKVFAVGIKYLMGNHIGSATLLINEDVYLIYRLMEVKKLNNYDL